MKAGSRDQTSLAPAFIFGNRSHNVENQRRRIVRQQENLMRQWIYAAATALSLATLGAAAPAQALSLPAGLAAPSDVQDAQFVFGGRNYCFYPNGWNGPGFYWCGYAWRRGFGWGGGRGWHGWDHRRPPHAYRPRPRPPHIHGRPGPRPHIHGGSAPRPHMGGRPGGGGGHRGGGGGHHR
jgi:hypothetical protein